jgi:thiamine transport system ATP-binding protein
MPEDGLVVGEVTLALGDRRVLDAVSLRVEPGEVVAVCGPSGCGKTTLLRVIAGILRPDSGRVHWGGADITDLPPHRRRVGLMFQDHALFPHRTVGENVAFGLRMEDVARRVRDERVRELLAVVGLPGYEGRSVGSLSGGEAQRVALARALAPAPAVVLLDEPLGSLDRLRREEVAGELRTILEATGSTAIHVTHDQDEAITIADRLGVMLDGSIRQLGPPLDVRSSPADDDVARFLGIDTILTPDLAARLGVGAETRYLPPEALAIRLDRGGAEGSVMAAVFRAGRYVHRLTVDGVEVSAVADDRLQPGTRVWLHVQN